MHSLFKGRTVNSVLLGLVVLVVGFLAAMLNTGLAGVFGAPISDPVPGVVPIGDLAVRVELVARLPDPDSGSVDTAQPMTVIGDGSGRRYVADQTGRVYRVHPDGSLSLFLDLARATDLASGDSQQGLSSIAFHPDYHSRGAAGEGKFYTSSAQNVAAVAPDYAVPAGAPTDHHSVVHEWTVSADPDAIDPASAREVLRIGQPYRDHNIGQIAFNPNIESSDPDYGLLYIVLGDGGRPVDPHHSGQNLGSPLGALLRIDPLEPSSGTAAYSIPLDNPYVSDKDENTLGEIFAHGLRNPHRFSWDTGGTQRMFISDMGQANIEEINIGALGANYGWSEREGTFLVRHGNEVGVFPLPPGDDANSYVYPIIQYDHDRGGSGISGGYVYRGSVPSGLQGEYVFGDLVTGEIFHVPAAALDGSGQIPFEVLRLIDADGQEKTLLEMVGGGIPARRADLRFGMDDAGNIYLVTKQDGAIRMLVPIRELRGGSVDSG